jgi:hypothetical protein
MERRISGQDTAHGIYNPFDTVEPPFGVINIGNGCSAHRAPEIGKDSTPDPYKQQHPAASVGKLNSHCACVGCLAHATLACEKNESCGPLAGVIKSLLVPVVGHSWISPYSWMQNRVWLC